MRSLPVSASHAALALVALLVATPLAGAYGPRSVGEIFVDAAGRAEGANLAASIDEAAGLLSDFHSVPAGREVFESLRIDGFAGVEKLAGSGSSALTLRGSNAVVTLHDDIHSAIKVRTTKPTLVTYRLSPELTATQGGANGGLVRITDAQGILVGHILAYGAEGRMALGESLQVAGGQVHARTQQGSELLFLAKADEGLVAGLLEGRIVSRYVTEFQDGAARVSQLDLGAHATARTTISGATGASTLVQSRVVQSAVLAYDLAYETLPAKHAGDVAVYVDGELAARAESAEGVLASARRGAAAYYAEVQDGRARILAATSDFVSVSERRVSVTAGGQASASTEQGSRAESASEDDARVAGSFQVHANGKLVGDFVTGLVPEGAGQLLGFTVLHDGSGTEVFRSVALDGNAAATLRTDAPDRVTLAGAKGELLLVDDALTTARLVARAPMDATLALSGGISGAFEGDDVLLLQGPRGSAGALLLHDPLGASTLSLDADGVVHAHLVPGASLLYRGAPDGERDDEAVLRGLAHGAFAAQVLVGSDAGSASTTAFAFRDDIDARARPTVRGVAIDLLVESDDAPRALLLDARGASLAAREAADLRVRVDGVEAVAVGSVEDVLADLPYARYHVATSAQGAVRVLVNAATLAGQLATVHVESLVRENAASRADAAALGAFRLFHDGTAVGEYVALKADASLAAVTGFSLQATQQPLFASIVAGHAPFLAVSGDGTGLLELEGREARIEVSDSTAALSKVVALADTTATFRLAADLRAHVAGPGVVELRREGGETVGTLVLLAHEHRGSLETRGEREVHATLEKGAEVAFRANAGIETELSDAERALLSTAMAGGRIGGTVLLQTQTTARETQAELTSAVAAAYGDMRIVTAATSRRVDVTVDSASETGKTLVLSLDPRTIPGLAQGKASLRFDGQVIAQASSYADVLDPNDDGDRAEYLVLAGDAGTGTLVLVSIPHFSVHTVTLEETVDHPNSLYMWATVVLGILALLEGALLLRSRLSHKQTPTNAPTNTVNIRRP